MSPMTEASDDGALVERTLAGDRNAFKVLVRRHDPTLRRLVYCMTRDAHKVDDILQDTYLKAFRSLGSYQRGRSFKAWLHRIAYTTALDAIRSHSRHSTGELDHDRAATTTSPDTLVAQHLDLAAALSTLSVRHRTAVLLIDGHDFTYDEVARVLRIPVGTVAYQLHLARKQLRHLLTDSSAEGHSNAN